MLPNLQGSLPVWLVTLIIGRDVALFSGAFVHRFHKVGWRWPGTTEFFRLSSPSGPETLTQQPEGSQTGSTTSSANLMYSTAQRTDHRSSDSSSSSSSRSDSSSQGQGTDGKTSTSVNASIAAISDIGSGASQQEKQEPSVGQEQARDKQSTQPAAFVQPLYISKVNTCFQLLLVGGCLSNSWYAWPSQEVMFYLGITVGCTTLASTAAYGIAYLQGKIK